MNGNFLPLAVTAGVLFAAYKYGPQPVKVMALGVAGSIVWAQFGAPMVAQVASSVSTSA